MAKKFTEQEMDEIRKAIEHYRQAVEDDYWGHRSGEYDDVELATDTVRRITGVNILEHDDESVEVMMSRILEQAEINELIERAFRRIAGCILDTGTEGSMRFMYTGNDEVQSALDSALAVPGMRLRVAKAICDAVLDATDPTPEAYGDFFFLPQDQQDAFREIIEANGRTVRKVR